MYVVNLPSILAYWMCLCVFVEDGVVLLFVCLGWSGLGGVGGGGVLWGCTSRGGCEMPRPCVKDIEQAQGNLQVSKSSLTCDHQWWSILC